MKRYDLITFEGLTPAAAKRELNAFLASILADRAHPYNDFQHPQHQDFARVFSSLNEMARAGDELAAREADEAFLAEALADEEPCTTVEECRARAAALLKTPDYLIHESGAEQMLDGEREKIRRKIHALHTIASRAEAAERANAEAERASAEAPEADGDGDGGDDDAW